MYVVRVYALYTLLVDRCKATQNLTLEYRNPQNLSYVPFTLLFLPHTDGPYRTRSHDGRYQITSS